MAMALYVLLTALFAASILFCVLARRRSRSRKTKPWERSGWLKSGDGIPAPTGSYEVGCVDLMHRLEGDSDGLLVRLFYPTDPGLAGQYQYTVTTPSSHHIYASLVDVFGIVRRWPGLHTFVALLKPLIDARCPGLYGAPIVCHRSVSSKPSHPVIVLSHGMAAMRTLYSALSCELASHGYVLACVEHRDRSACTTVRKIPKPGAPGEYQDEWISFMPFKGRWLKDVSQAISRNNQLKHRADEVGKALDLLQLLNEGGDVTNMMGEKFDWGQFRGRLQLNTAAVMGHSFGGSTTIQALYTDKRFKCGIALDCWMLPILDDQLEEKLEQPLIFINSDFDFQWPAAIRQMMKLVQAPDNKGISKCQILTLKGSNHFHQCDVYLTSNSFGSIAKEYSSPRSKSLTLHQVNADICLAFLQRFLLEDPTYQQRVPNLDGGDGASEHIIFGTNIDCDHGPDEGGLSFLPFIQRR